MSRAVDLTMLGMRMRVNSERWFPQVHAGKSQLAHYTLGLVGEAGEVANAVKKLLDYRDDQAGEQALAEELADVFTYLLLLADELGVDLVAEYDRKALICEERWGEPRS